MLVTARAARGGACAVPVETGLRREESIEPSSEGTLVTMAERVECFVKGFPFYEVVILWGDVESSAEVSAGGGESVGLS